MRSERRNACQLPMHYAGYLPCWANAALTSGEGVSLVSGARMMDKSRLAARRLRVGDGGKVLRRPIDQPGATDDLLA